MFARIAKGTLFACLLAAFIFSFSLPARSLPLYFATPAALFIALVVAIRLWAPRPVR